MRLFIVMTATSNALELSASGLAITNNLLSIMMWEVFMQQ